MLQLFVKSFFDSAHLLNNYAGKCTNLHGHTWKVECCFNVTKIEKNGISVDFSILKKKLEDVLPDHTYLNDWIYENPTAENISKVIYFKVKNAVKELTNIELSYVEVAETPNNKVRYYGEG